MVKNTRIIVVLIQTIIVIYTILHEIIKIPQNKEMLFYSFLR